MSSLVRNSPAVLNSYPTSDGRPMAETDWHRELMNELIKTLQAYYASDPMVYVSGNLLLFYEPGNRRRHVSPDVFVVKGIPKHERPNYLMWEENKAPDFVIELTSKSTRKEDVEEKFQLYRDTLRVKEYFLFDPRNEYLRPSLRGYRLRGGKYAPIRPTKGRYPSQVVGLHLARHNGTLRLYDPRSENWLPTSAESRANVEANLAERVADARAILAEAREQLDRVDALRRGARRSCRS